MLLDVPPELLSIVIGFLDVPSWYAAVLCCRTLRQSSSTATIFRAILGGWCVHSANSTRLMDYCGRPHYACGESVERTTVWPGSVAIALEEVTMSASLALIKQLWPYLDPRRQHSNALHVLSLSASAICTIETTVHTNPLTNAWLFDGVAAAIKRKLIVYSAHTVVEVRLAHVVQQSPSSPWAISSGQQRRTSGYSCAEQHLSETHRARHSVSWCPVMPLIAYGKYLSQCVMLTANQGHESRRRDRDDAIRHEKPMERDAGHLAPELVEDIPNMPHSEPSTRSAESTDVV